MRSYEAARSLYSFLGFLAWCMIVGGGLFAVAAASLAGQMRGFGGPPSGLAVIMAMLPGLAIALLGFFNLAIVENGRAAVDTAEYSQQMLKVARDTLEVSRQSLAQADDLRQGFESLRVRDPEPARVSFGEMHRAGAGTAPEAPAPEIPAASGAVAVQAFEPEEVARHPEQTALEHRPPVDPLLGAEIEPSRPVTAGDTAAVTAGAAQPIPEPVLYRGLQIVVQGGRHCVGNRGFRSLEGARRYIDEHLNGSA